TAAHRSGTLDSGHAVRRPKAGGPRDPAPSGMTEGTTFMSDFDRNIAARGGFAGRAVAVDAGLRAYMLRVYNYMAAAVALSGVVAYATFNAAVVTDASGKITALTPFGQTIFSGPTMIVLLLGTLGLVFFISFRINRLQFTTAMTLFMAYAALLGVTLSSIFLVYTGASI